MSLACSWVWSLSLGRGGRSFWIHEGPLRWRHFSSRCTYLSIEHSTFLLIGQSTRTGHFVHGMFTKRVFSMCPSASSRFLTWAEWESNDCVVCRCRKAASWHRRTLCVWSIRPWLSYCRCVERGKAELGHFLRLKWQLPSDPASLTNGEGLYLSKLLRKRPQHSKISP